MGLVKPGEGIHLIERRLFPGDVRRHFVGRVEECSEHGMRVRGHLFVYDSGTSNFLKKTELRTRIVPWDNRVIINVLPDGVATDAIRYHHDDEGNLSITDGSGFDLDISEFSPKE